MLKLNTNCPLHSQPLQFVVITEKTHDFLRCKACPFEPTSLRISNEVEYMKARMGTQKTKQRQKSRSRSKSKSKSKQAITQEEEEKQLALIQRIAEQQVIILEIVMKLLTEDQKKYQDNLQKSVTEYRKLWKQYEESTSNVMALNKLYQKNLLPTYIACLSKNGWNELKTILKSLYNRSFICKRIIKQSKEIMQNLKISAKIGQESILKSLEIMVGRAATSACVEQEKGQKPQENKEKNKRSKSFNGIK